MLTFVSSASITLRQRHMLHMLSYDRHGGWGKSSRTIIAGTQQLDGTWTHLKKMATSIHAPQKETTGVPKTVKLCLQLDLASQRCLVTDCSISTATGALAPLTSNSGKKLGLNTALIDVIWMTQNHKILMFFFPPVKRKIESPRRRNSNFHS